MTRQWLVTKVLMVAMLLAGLGLAGCTSSNPEAAPTTEPSTEGSQIENSPSVAEKVATTDDYVRLIRPHDTALNATVFDMGDCLYRPTSIAVSVCRSAPAVLRMRLIALMSALRNAQDAQSANYVGEPPITMARDVKRVMESARAVRNVVDEAESAACTFGEHKKHCQGFYSYLAGRASDLTIQLNQLA